MKSPKIIYCDFDGTVTKGDSVNRFLSLYADKSWLNVEQNWLDGKIGSKECLRAQVDLVPAMPSSELLRFINSIEIDDSFLDFYEQIKLNGYKLVILSDGFDLFIDHTLRKYDLSEIKYYANTLRVENGKLGLEFKYSNADCPHASGVCKCARVNEDVFCYIGDGLSDSCIAKKADTLFAKNGYNLQKYCDANGIAYISFDSFKDIIDYFSLEGELNAKFDYINN